MAEFTLIGFEKYLQASDSSLFADVVLPEGIDKEVLLDTIILKGGEFEPVYLDPYFMKSAIKSWSIKWNRTFTKWLTALSIDYNPLENYDRFEEWANNSTDDRTESATAHDVSNSTGSGTTNNGRSAYNSASDYNKHDNSVTNSLGSNESTANTEAEGSNKHNDTHSGRMHGNIGVTTSQQMLQSELDIAKWSLYDQIADMFINEFLIMIY